jgi:hypothetical protein
LTFRAAAAQRRSPARQNAWADYIKRELDRREAAMSGAVADVIGKALAAERSARQKAETEITVIRQELSALRTEVSDLRAEVRVRGSLDEVQTRIDRIERERTERTPLKAVT